MTATAPAIPVPAVLDALHVMHEARLALLSPHAVLDTALVLRIAKAEGTLRGSLENALPSLVQVAA